MVSEIAINGRFLGQPLTGVQRYSLEVLKVMDRLLTNGEIDPNGCRLTCYTPPSYRDIPATWKTIRVSPAGFLNGNLWEQIDLAVLARGKTLFSPGNIGPAVLPGQIVTIHDASVFAVPEAYSIWFRMKYRLILSILGKTARKIITVSEFSKCELMKYCRIPEEKIAVIPHGSEHLDCLKADQAVFERFDIGKKPYLLTVGSDSPHKNLGVLAEALRRMDRTDFEVVMVGGAFRWFSKDHGEAWPETVRRIGYVNDCELRALYERAAALVFPSKYEGFGMPVLEAMTSGCPVICSRTASLPEVGGDAVLYFDLEKPEELKEQIERVLGDERLREVLRCKGLVRTAMFSWDEAARRTWGVMRASLP
ncbi:MAG TPA: glycosyltransferase family 1 protein [Anaerolineaceae bacterium]|nr:glycosyltransferase family 1 protein [Anaerolineaceae bacterium]